MIYLNNAATTRPQVRRQVDELLINHWFNPSSIEGKCEKEMIEEAREMIKQILNADEVIFTSGATESNNIVTDYLYNEHQGFVLCSPFEHPSIADWISDGTIDCNKFGLRHDISVEWNEDREDAPVVICMGVNNETGYIPDIKRIGERCEEKGYIYFCDATQMVGHHEIDMEEMKINILTGSAHKFGGLKGVGFIAYNNFDPIKANFGGGQEKSYRSGTENLVGIVTMAEQLKFMNSNIEENCHKVNIFNRYMTEQIINRVKDVFFPMLCLDYSPYILNFCVKGINGEALVHILSLKGVIVSSGSACHTGSIEASKTLKAFQVPDEYIHGAIRVSFSPENTMAEIEDATEVIIQCIEILRNINGGLNNV